MSSAAAAYGLSVLVGRSELHSSVIHLTGNVDALR
jgi:hypothetical protein